MSRPTTPTYKTLDWPAHNEALTRRGSLTIWFDPEMAWATKRTGKRGRQPLCSDAAVLTCPTMKVLFGMALRRTTGFVEIRTHPSGLMRAARRPPLVTLDRQAKSGDLSVIRQPTWGMSGERLIDLRMTMPHSHDEDHDTRSYMETPGNGPDDLFPLDHRAFMDAIRQILDNLDATNFGDYRLQVGVGVAELQIFNHWESTIDTFIFSTDGGTVTREEDPSPEIFDLPPEFKPSGPEFGFGYDYL